MAIQYLVQQNDKGDGYVTAARRDAIPMTLMSVTWRHEGGFKMNPDSYVRYAQDNESVVGYDVGPLQSSTNYYNKEKFTRGFDNPFGSAPILVDIMQQVGQGAPKALPKHLAFDGNADEMIHVSARAFTLDILPRSRGRSELNRLADAVGIYRGSGDYQGRHDQYLAEAPNDKNFLDCLLK